jgi:GNAT superfamily N-acetyltransferase
MLIRKATVDDCPQIMDLIKELAAYEKAPDEVTVTLSHFIESGFGDKPIWEAFVAETHVNSKIEIIGFALYYIRYSTWKGQRMYLEDLLVTYKMRGKGVGKFLFDALIEECTTQKYSGLVWQVLDWNEPAINFYKKFDGVKFDGEWVNCSMEI